MQRSAYATQRLCKTAKLPEAGSVTCMCVQVQVVSRGVGHFDVYMGAAFDDVVEEQLAFLQVRMHFPCLAQHCYSHHLSDRFVRAKRDVIEAGAASINWGFCAQVMWFRLPPSI